VVRHMYNEGHISTEDFDYCMEYGERPKVPHDWLPDEVKAKEMASAMARSALLGVDRSTNAYSFGRPGSLLFSGIMKGLGRKHKISIRKPMRTTTQ